MNAGEVEGGIQVNGASGSENSFTVDGVVTNSLINGASRQDAVFEYLQEVQVKTGGISAEYGGALGGVISAVTKSGGNAYRGEAHYYFTGAGTSAAPVERLVLNPADDITVNYFQDEEQPNNRHDIGGSHRRPDPARQAVLLRVVGAALRAAVERLHLCRRRDGHASSRSRRSTAPSAR